MSLKEIIKNLDTLFDLVWELNWTLEQLFPKPKQIKKKKTYSAKISSQTDLTATMKSADDFYDDEGVNIEDSGETFDYYASILEQRELPIDSVKYIISEKHITNRKKIKICKNKPVSLTETDIDIEPTRIIYLQL